MCYVYWCGIKEAKSVIHSIERTHAHQPPTMEKIEPTNSINQSINQPPKRTRGDVGELEAPVRRREGHVRAAVQNDLRV